MKVSSLQKVLVGIAVLGCTTLSLGLTIDFTDDYYQDIVAGQEQQADGRYATDWFTVEGTGLEIRLTADPADQMITWNSSEGFSTGDGLGIGDDEVKTDLQALTIDFREVVQVESIELLDLFYEKDNSKSKALRDGEGYTEIGHLAISGGETVSFIADVFTSAEGDAYDYGYKHVEVSSTVWTTSVTASSQQQKVFGNDISSIEEVSFGGDNDYALAKLTVNRVPEPGSLSLMATGLIALFGSMGLSRRKKNRR